MEIKIQVFCNNDVIAERVSKREGICFEEAKGNLKKRDEADKKRYNELYGINPESEEYYNYFVDTSNLEVDDYKLIADDILNKVDLLKKGEKLKFEK